MDRYSDVTDEATSKSVLGAACFTAVEQWSSADHKARGKLAKMGEALHLRGVPASFSVSLGTSAEKQAEMKIQAVSIP